MLKRKNARYNFSDGFALPTIMIASVVMTIVLLAGLTASTSVISSVEEQYVQRVVRDTAESGMVLARECILAGETGWSELHTGDDCDGGNTCAGNACYVINDTDNNVRTWFEVGAATSEGSGYGVEVTAYYERLRASDDSVYRSANDTIKSVISTGNFTVSEFSGGHRVVCSIANTGLARCLGSNTSYTLGNGEGPSYSTPTFELVGGSLSGVTVSNIDVRSLHGCAISGGDVHCWGSDHHGALGNGAGTVHQDVAGPVDTSGVLAGKTMTKVTTGGTADNAAGVYAHTCALDSDGYAYCWGSNSAPAGGGQLGDGTTIARDVPVAVGAVLYNTIDSGAYHTCAIRISGEKLFCWGSDSNGQIGNSGGSHVSAPTAVQGPLLNIEFGNANFTKLASGHLHNCAINSDNNGMWCWGYNLQGQLGDGTTTTRQTAVKVTLPAGETGWADVVAGAYHTCGQTLDGSVYCWGGADPVGTLQGQIGDGSSSGANRTSPTAVDTSGVLSGKTLTHIWSSWSSSIVRDDTSHYYSWGVNNHAQLGTGVKDDPVQAYSPIDPEYFNDPSTGSESSAGIAY